MIISKKPISRLFALMLVASLLLTGCLNNKNFKNVFLSDDYTVTSGVYLAYLNDAYLTAKEKLEDPTKDILNSKVEDIDATEWILAETLKSSKLNVFTEREALEKSIALTNDEKEANRLKAQSQFALYHDYYEDNGIGEKSLEKIFNNVLLYEKTFESVYGKNGSYPVSDVDINNFDNNNYEKISYFSISLNSINFEGDTKTNVENLVNSLIEEINKGGDFEQLSKSYYVRIYAELGNVLSEPTQSLLSDVFVDKDDYTSLFTEEFTNEIIATELNKANAKYLDTQILIYKKTPRTEKDYTDRKDQNLRNFKDDEYQDYLIDKYKNHHFEANQEAIKYYSPNKIK
ncbi:MAG: hypothetical protein ACRCZK_03950 [Oscillospiraceae bacterium]